MRRLGLVFAAALLPALPQVPDTALYGAALQKYVRADGLVDYAGLRSDPGPLEAFVAQLAKVSPDSSPKLFPTRADRLAYWINAYNALVLKAFSSEYPEKRNRLQGLLGKARFFYRSKHTVGGIKRTLADIEDNSIRTEEDPRIHFAIVCASASCPWLSRTPYTASNLQQQLEGETQRYFLQSRNFRLDEQRREVWLPQILEWFRGDFGGTPSAVLRFVARYRTAEASKLRSGAYRIRYIPYDWSPNDVR